MAFLMKLAATLKSRAVAMASEWPTRKKKKKKSQGKVNILTRI